MTLQAHNIHVPVISLLPTSKWKRLPDLLFGCARYTNKDEKKTKKLKTATYLFEPNLSISKRLFLFSFAADHSCEWLQLAEVRLRFIWRSAGTVQSGVESHFLGVFVPTAHFFKGPCQIILDQLAAFMHQWRPLIFINFDNACFNKMEVSHQINCPRTTVEFEVIPKAIFFVQIPLVLWGEFHC